MQLGANVTEEKVFRAHAAPPGLRDNLVNALKLLANRQKDGDCPIQSIATCLHERSRRVIMDKQRILIVADNRSAVDVGGLRRGTISIPLQKPQLSEAFPEAVIREGADKNRPYKLKKFVGDQIASCQKTAF